MRGLLLEGDRRGTTIRLSSKDKLIPSTKKSSRPMAQRKVRAGNRDYTEEEKEDLALDLVATVLAMQKGLRLEDIRDQPNAGADAVDRQRDIWVELKAHGKDMPDVIRLEPSEFELAERKKGKYLLAIVWGLEASRKPDYVLISDPSASARSEDLGSHPPVGHSRSSAQVRQLIRSARPMTCDRCPSMDTSPISRRRSR